MKNSRSNEWYTPSRVFDALGCEFDLDVACPSDMSFIKVPAKRFIHEKSLELTWDGFIWMNPPFNGKEDKQSWLNKIYEHGNGIALTPDRTSAPWWPVAAKQCDALMFVSGKIKFIKQDGTIGKNPGTGTTLFAYGKKAVIALVNAEKNKLGIVLYTQNKQE